MNTPRPAFTPNGGTSWLDWVLDPRTNAVLFDEVDHARAELAELRKERDELREAILKLGYLTGTEGYCGDHVVLTVRLNPLEANTWNALVAKVSAEKGEETGQ